MKIRKLLDIFKMKYGAYITIVFFLFLLSEIVNTYSFARYAQRDRTREIRFLADTISTAVSFQSYDSVAEIVKSGDFKEKFESIWVFDKDSKLIAQYGESKKLEDVQKEPVSILINKFVSNEIVSNNEGVGRIVVAYRTDFVYTKLLIDLSIFLIVMLALIATSAYFVRSLRIILINPLLKFTFAVDEVSKTNDLEKARGELVLESQVEEMVNLRDSFGRMISSLREQQKKLSDSQKALQDVNQNLEKMIEQKTEKLNKTIENLKSFQNKLVAQEKLASIGTLAAGIAHEIKNPLNLINNSAQVVTEFIEEDLAPLLVELENEEFKAKYEFFAEDVKGVKAACAMIVKNGLRADSIIRNLLAQSRNEKPHFEEVSLKSVIEEYFLLSYHAMRANIGMSVDKELVIDDVGMVNIVTQDIGRALVNIFDNAYYSMQKKLEDQGRDYHPHISVSLHRRDESSVRLLITDNGQGISKEVQSKIFEPFYTTKPKGEGTGLGLSIGFDIIRTHQGEISLTSDLGGPTTFEIILPLMDTKVDL